MYGRCSSWHMCVVFACVWTECVGSVHSLDTASSARPEAWGRNSVILFTGAEARDMGCALGLARGLRRAAEAKGRGRGQGSGRTISRHTRGWLQPLCMAACPLPCHPHSDNRGVPWPAVGRGQIRGDGRVALVCGTVLSSQPLLAPPHLSFGLSSA